MFIFSFKASKIKAFCIIALCAAVVFALVSLLPGISSKGNVNKLDSVQSTNEINVKSEKGRMEFFSFLGYSVKQNPVSKNESTLPKQFDSVMREYNKLQQRQGYDLSKYCGKKVTGYTYEVTAFPDDTVFSQGDYLATIIVYKNKVVAADLTNISNKTYMPLIKVI